MTERSERSNTVIETDRLLLRELVTEDAPFILRLLNEPSWLRHIGDKQVHSLEDAERYINDGPRTSYYENGFGLYLVTIRTNEIPVGVCGLLKRKTLEHPDIGFALLPEYWGQGYAFEAARGVMNHVTVQMRMPRVAGITKADNSASIKLLQRLGMRLEGTVKLNELEPELLLFMTPNEAADWK